MLYCMNLTPWLSVAGILSIPPATICGPDAAAGVVGRVLGCLGHLSVSRLRSGPSSFHVSLLIEIGCGIEEGRGENGC
ncbi:hypothetical protein SLA2020_234590 [Shorea laevis]